jgi:hypothetical protein
MVKLSFSTSAVTSKIANGMMSFGENIVKNLPVVPIL